MRGVAITLQKARVWEEIKKCGRSLAEMLDRYIKRQLRLKKKTYLNNSK